MNGHTETIFPHTPLIDAESLHNLVRKGEVRILDCRNSLDKPQLGEAQYQAGHIPGATYMSLEKHLAAPADGKHGRHPLPAPETFISYLHSLGIDTDTPVVVYDDGSIMMASRCWWMLRWVGFTQVALLDGGLKAWQDAGYEVTTEIVNHPAIQSSARQQAVQDDLAVSVDDVVDNLTSQAYLVIDARAPRRFAGLEEPQDTHAGHIPGAVNHFFKNNLDAQGKFLPVAEIRAQFTALLDTTRPEQVIHQCGSGISATVNLLAMEYAGLKGSRLYPGSWSEWIQNPDRPIAKD